MAEQKLDLLKLPARDVTEPGTRAAKPQYLLGLVGVHNWSQSCLDFNDFKMRELNHDGTRVKANTEGSCEAGV